jgi:AcrR family transcriptional regulator
MRFETRDEKGAPMDETPAPRPYRHGNLPNALRAAARAILDESGPESVGLRETARRVGVSATAAYRHFSSKEDLLSSVAAEGFRELTAAMEASAEGRDPLVGVGLAYVEFALQKRGLFRLMFGPVLVERAKYPALNDAANAAFDCVQRVASGVDNGREGASASMAAWGLVHGLSALFIDDLVPEGRARILAEEILHAGAKPEHQPAA